MKNYLLTLSYDGTDYHGWQRQKNQITVQEEVENAIAKLIGAPVSVTASGRTDEGVHALGQTANFECDTNIPADKFADALNTFLPQDIRALSCREVPLGFSARKSAKRKTYAYSFYLSSHVLPPLDRFALRVGAPLDEEAIAAACHKIEGTHDFAKFYCLGSSAKTTVRTVYSCKLIRADSLGADAAYRLEICGDGFLYKMVRLIAGALLRLSDGKITLGELESAVESKADLQKIPAPSKGLSLLRVEYENN